ncbi:MAG: hypothetical protein OHK0039_38560 [Bacteroidia bacterium]
MRLLTRVLILVLFGGMGLAAFAGSVAGWGIGGLASPAVRTQIEQQCPGYYRNRDGNCLGNTFRSYFLVRSLQGGGFGNGGK